MKFIDRIKKRIINFFFKLPRKTKFLLLSTCHNVSGKAKMVQPCQLNGYGSIVFGKDVVIGYELSPFLYSGYGYIEARHQKAKIVIDDNVVINNNIVLISEREGIFIGKNVLIGTQCEIYDSDFHALNPKSRREGEAVSASVHICENVFIGSNVKILKGVTIGKNSIIANSSVVTKSIPENVMAGGIPAKILKMITEE